MRFELAPVRSILIRGLRPPDPLLALSLGASPPRSVREARFAALARGMRPRSPDPLLAVSLTASSGADHLHGVYCIRVATEDRFHRADIARAGEGPPLPYARSAATAADAQRHRAQHPSGTCRGFD